MKWIKLVLYCYGCGNIETFVTSVGTNDILFLAFLLFRAIKEKMVWNVCNRGKTMTELVHINSRFHNWEMTVCEMGKMRKNKIQMDFSRFTHFMYLIHSVYTYFYSFVECVLESNTFNCVSHL